MGLAMKMTPGAPYPLGATFDGDGTNFAVYSEHATGVELCLFGDSGTEICGGDEIGRTQLGNNNAYCQDNETSWYDWALDEERKALFEFVRKVIGLRVRHPALRRARFFKGRAIRGADIRDIMWFRHDGEEMTEQDWNTPYTRALQMQIAGLGVDEVDENGNPIVDDDLLLVINGSHESIEFTTPATDLGASPWELVLYTGDDAATESVHPHHETHVESRSLKLFRRPACGASGHEAAPPHIARDGR